jgi:hypothetical protein
VACNPSGFKLPSHPARNSKISQSEFQIETKKPVCETPAFLLPIY